MSLISALRLIDEHLDHTNLYRAEVLSPLLGILQYMVPRARVDIICFYLDELPRFVVSCVFFFLHILTIRLNTLYTALLLLRNLLRNLRMAIERLESRLYCFCLSICLLQARTRTAQR